MPLDRLKYCIIAHQTDETTSLRLAIKTVIKQARVGWSCFLIVLSFSWLATTSLSIDIPLFFETMLYVTLLEIVILVRILIMIVAFRWDCTPSYRWDISRYFHSLRWFNLTCLFILQICPSLIETSGTRVCSKIFNSFSRFLISGKFLLAHAAN